MGLPGCCGIAYPGRGRSIDPATAAHSQAMASPSAQVIQETSGLLCESSEGNQYIPDSQRLSYPKVHLVSTERTST